MWVKKQEWNELVVEYRKLRSKVEGLLKHTFALQEELDKVKEELKLCRKVDMIPDEKPVTQQQKLDEWLGGEKGDW